MSATFIKRNSTEVAKSIYQSNLIYATQRGPLTMKFTSKCLPSKYSKSGGKFCKLMVADDLNEYSLVVEPELEAVIDSAPVGVYIDLVATGGQNTQAGMTWEGTNQPVQAPVRQQAPVQQQTPTMAVTGTVQPARAADMHVVVAQQTMQVVALFAGNKMELDPRGISAIFNTLYIAADRRN